MKYVFSQIQVGIRRHFQQDIIFVMILGLLWSGCGSGGQGSAPSPTPTPTPISTPSPVPTPIPTPTPIAISGSIIIFPNSPNPIILFPGVHKSFYFELKGIPGGANNEVVWQLMTNVGGIDNTGKFGEINQDGLYIAPLNPSSDLSFRLSVVSKYSSKINSYVNIKVVKTSLGVIVR